MPCHTIPYHRLTRSADRLKMHYMVWGKPHGAGVFLLAPPTKKTQIRGQAGFSEVGGGIASVDVCHPARYGVTPLAVPTSAWGAVFNPSACSRLKNVPPERVLHLIGTTCGELSKDGIHGVIHGISSSFAVLHNFFKQRLDFQ